ncbi:sugar ABC transporter permease [Clostridium sp. YIM B02515]|uniref:Maltose/maltodextrin transport system permease protein n=1 Tax=Clostridium rhizosphaerae TaxID=2803861 RepID=A0ABS1T9L3_9CLOT|nr:sugar ABC transporter permease [Clostridium rhizosphaerae]MBL4936046.1 sugar ABC transporter permease [Clostridium rhizosphaerae]
MERKKKGNFYDRIRGYVYLSPALISIAVLSLIPIIYTIYIAFTNYNINHMEDFKIVGFDNFKQILAGPLKPIFLPVFAWTLAFAIILTLGNYFIGLFIAMLLNNNNMKERGLYKGLFIIPWALPSAIAILSWQGLLNQDYGTINLMLTKLHIISANIPWLTDVTWARVGVIMVSLWLGFPYMMNVCLGALASIPDNYYEAAEIDGANRWQKFVKITLPSLTSSSIPLIISSFSFNFNNFGAAYLITAGGPPKPNTSFAGSTDILASSAFKMIGQPLFRYDLAAALSILIFILIGTISFFQMKMSGAFEEVD